MAAPFTETVAVGGKLGFGVNVHTGEPAFAKGLARAPNKNRTGVLNKMGVMLISL